MERKIKVGVIGQGRSGRNIHSFALEHQRLRECFELVAVCDLIPERTKESCENNPGCKAYTDYREMLADPEIELIVNATPSLHHVNISIEALEAGHAVLCEKPLASNVADVERLQETIKRTGKFFAVFQQSRFAPLFRKVREVMNSGDLGRIVMVKMAFNNFARRWDWQTLQYMAAGNLLNTGPHPLDQALQLMGNVDPEQILCIMDRANTFGDAEDHVKLIMTAKDHPTVDLEISSCSMYNPYVYQVYGTHGSLIGDHTKLDWKYYKPEETPAQKLITTPMPERAYCFEDLSFYQEHYEASVEGGKFDFRTEMLYLNLYQAMINGKPLEVQFDEVKRQIKVIEECHRQNPLSKKFFPAE